jgi:PAS domain S-box-containing protein
MEMGKNKLLAGFYFLALAVLVGIVIFAYLHIRDLLELNDLTARSRQVLKKVDDLHDNLVGIESSQRGYIITGDPRFLKAFQQALDQTPIIINEIKELTVNHPSVESLIAATEPLINQRLALLQDRIGLAESGRREAAIQAIKTGVGQKLMTDIRSSIAAINKQEDEILAHRQTLARANDRKIIYTVTLGSLWSFGTLIAIFYFLRRENVLRRAAEQSLRLSEERLQTFLENSPAVSFMKDEAGRYVYVNGIFKQMVFQNRSDLVGLTDFDLWPAELAKSFQKEDWSVFSENKPLETLTSLTDVDGNLHHFIVYKFLIPNSWGKRMLGGVALDISERKQLEIQLNQAKKLEAIGQLAAGVAHDFNNLLTIIIGCGDMMLMELSQDDPLRSHAQEITRAAESAARLTQQLLAFSRKQIVQPRALNLNEVVTELKEMLQSLLTEEVHFLVALAPDLGVVCADPGQMKQIILNLVANSRDAMSRGGQLTIKTANVWLDEVYAQKYAEVTPGPYIMLAVADTGEGMDLETIDHIFDPFFTTKEVGKGTGLGLASVYGIVKQSGGHTRVYSEPGLGTNFEIYFPQVPAVNTPLPVEAPLAELPRGQETVLVVEDGEELRVLIRQALQKWGYTILEARNGEEGVSVCEQHAGQIDLLLIDIILPHIRGPEVAAWIKSAYPKMKVLFMSGYTDNALVNQGVIDMGINFIQKPFKIGSLIRKVREVFDKPMDQ